MTGPLTDATAIVTGASSGIGEATVHALAREGADVVLAARSEDTLEEIASTVAEEHDVATHSVTTDVSQSDDVAALVETAVERCGGLDVVVANAGLGYAGSIENLDTEEYRSMIDVNVDGAFFTAREAIPHLRESEGSLVFMGSFAGQYPRPNDAVYAATKWWVRGFARSVEAEVGPDGVAVTTINPAEVRTDFGGEGGEAMADRFEEGAVTSPETIADAVVFAARQRPPNTVSELDLYRRDKLADF